MPCLVIRVRSQLCEEVVGSSSVCALFGFEFGGCVSGTISTQLAEGNTQAWPRNTSMALRLGIACAPTPACLLEEGVILARFLKGITLTLAHRYPDDEHAQSLAEWLGCGLFLRLRAAVFVNLVGMREAISLSQNPGVLLEERNVKMLQSAAYLWHSAFNSVAP